MNTRPLISRLQARVSSRWAGSLRPRASALVVLLLLVPSGGFGEMSSMPLLVTHVPGPPGLRRAYTLPIVPMPPPPAQRLGGLQESPLPVISTERSEPLAASGAARTDAEICGDRVQVRAIVSGDRDTFAVLAIAGESVVARRGKQIGDVTVLRIEAGQVAVRIHDREVRCVLRGKR